jgi:hypothetical protein
MFRPWWKASVWVYPPTTAPTHVTGQLPMQMPSGMKTVEEQYEDVPRDMECHTETEGNTYDFAFITDNENMISIYPVSDGSEFKQIFQFRQAGFKLVNQI